VDTECIPLAKYERRLMQREGEREREENWEL